MAAAFDVDLILDPDNQGTLRDENGDRIGYAHATGFKLRIEEVYAIHGTMAGPGSDLASLFVYRLITYNSSMSKWRRFKAVTLKLEFVSKSGKPADDPQVKCHAPAQNGWIGTLPTKVERESKQAVGADATAGVPGHGALRLFYGSKNGWKWEKHLLATVNAILYRTSEGRGRVGDNGVEWTAHENEWATPTTMPDLYQFAVIVKRRDNQEFTAKAHMYAHVDALHDTTSAIKRATKSVKDGFTKLFPAKTPEMRYHPDRKPYETGTLEYSSKNPVSSDAIGKWIPGMELDKLAYLHVVENVGSAEVYAMSESADDDSGKKGDDADNSKKKDDQEDGDDGGDDGDDDNTRDNAVPDEQGDGQDGQDDAGQGDGASRDMQSFQVEVENPWI
jgi:hypothetical protein